MTSCLLCAASGIEPGAWIRVQYNSARSDDEQSARGKVREVYARPDGTCQVKFERRDGQKMTVHENGKLISHGSHAPITGYAYRYEVKT